MSRGGMDAGATMPASLATGLMGQVFTGFDHLLISGCLKRIFSELPTKCLKHFVPLCACRGKAKDGLAYILSAPLFLVIPEVH